VTPPASASGAQEKPAITAVKKEGKAGSQLWGETCGRCHNFRSPSSYNAKEWDVAMRHMRLRAYLTAEEEKAIAEFIESASDGEPKVAAPRTQRR